MAYQARRILCANLLKSDKIGTMSGMTGMMRFHTMVGYTTAANRNTGTLYQAVSMPQCQLNDDLAAVDIVQGVQGELDSKGCLEAMEHTKLTSAEERDMVSQGVQGDLNDRGTVKSDSRLQPEDMTESAAVYTVQGVQGELDSKGTQSMGTLSKAMENAKLTLAEKRAMVSQGVQSDLYAPKRVSTYSGEDPHLELMAANTGVSLYSVMQSNVPEPFSPSQRGTPSHVNMPGGGEMRQDKYTYSGVQSCHPSRSYSSLANRGTGTDISKLFSSVDRPDSVISLARQTHSKGDSESE